MFGYSIDFDYRVLEYSAQPYLQACIQRSAGVVGCGDGRCHRAAHAADTHDAQTPFVVCVCIDFSCRGVATGGISEYYRYPQNQSTLKKSNSWLRPCSVDAVSVALSQRRPRTSCLHLSHAVPSSVFLHLYLKPAAHVR